MSLNRNFNLISLPWQAFWATLGLSCTKDRRPSCTKATSSWTRRLTRGWAQPSTARTRTSPPCRDTGGRPNKGSLPPSSCLRWPRAARACEEPVYHTWTSNTRGRQTQLGVKHTWTSKAPGRQTHLDVTSTWKSKAFWTQTVGLL